jgi:hypothetical protein
MFWGKMVAPFALKPFKHSAWIMAGIPRLVFSIRNRWISLLNAAISLGARPEDLPTALICPIPYGIIAAALSADNLSCSIRGRSSQGRGN